MEYVESIQLCALRDVVYRKSEYLLRRIMRWYSEKFHTPLLEVENIPIEIILQHYFECIYEEQESQDRLEEIKSLIKDKEEVEQQEIKKEASESEFYQMVQKELKENQNKEKVPNKKQINNDKLKSLLRFAEQDSLGPKKK
ncbi:MAG: hypothetical protein KGO96_07715 [Elusimicrobia bacterium]|nr:hypothetical protein [Elusimicrobiota bacterium]